MRIRVENAAAWSSAQLGTMQVVSSGDVLKLCTLVSAEAEEVWRPALLLLVEIVDAAEGDDAAALGAAVRELGVTDFLASFTVHEDPEVHQAAQDCSARTRRGGCSLPTAFGGSWVSSLASCSGAAFRCCRREHRNDVARDFWHAP